MDLSEIKYHVTKIIKEMKDLSEFDESIEMIKSGMFDSFDIMNLVTNLQEKFKVSIDGEDLIPENFEKIENITNLIRQKLDE